MILIDSNNNYPRYIGDIILENPSWKEGDALPDGWHEVTPAEFPEIPEAHTFEENFPELIDGVYQQSYTVRPFTDKELIQVNSPKTASEKLKNLGFTEDEITMIRLGLIA
tara:strand:+ start:1877 stop:2206 length:330 start_codon:yes stop_codon:yes gene_type:complete